MQFESQNQYTKQSTAGNSLVGKTSYGDHSLVTAIDSTLPDYSARYAGGIYGCIVTVTIDMRLFQLTVVP